MIQIRFISGGRFVLTFTNPSSQIVDHLNITDDAWRKSCGIYMKILKLISGTPDQ